MLLIHDVNEFLIAFTELETGKLFSSLKQSCQPSNVTAQINNPGYEISLLSVKNDHLPELPSCGQPSNDTDVSTSVTLCN